LLLNLALPRSLKRSGSRWYHPQPQILAVNVASLAAAAAFYVLLAHDRPFIGAITVSPKPLLQREEGHRGGEIPRHGLERGARRGVAVMAVFAQISR
jgi:hypothetical protein